MLLRLTGQQSFQRSGISDRVCASTARSYRWVEELALKRAHWMIDAVIFPRRRITLFLASALSFLSSQSSAEFLTLTYTEQAIKWNSTLDLIAQTQGLSVSDAFTTKQIAAAWQYLGPCRGSANDLSTAGEGAISFVMTADPTIPTYAAVLEMIGSLGRENLGRQPPADLCRFARETANSH